jgi:hypothetical protein
MTTPTTPMTADEVLAILDSAKTSLGCETYSETLDEMLGRAIAAVAAVYAERDALREALNILHAHSDDPAVWEKVDAILAQSKGGAS